ncbi:hypothetical protein BHM03_00015282 [Ensete ventricosum]|nr:hypothetical protein BHM03_00015282 [Ensete ventricosum]
MSLQESLNRFKQQQEKCQSTLSSIAARAASSKPAQPQPYKATPSSAPSKAIASVKFSNDTERLQHINAIRKSPVGAQLKRVIDLLFEAAGHVWLLSNMDSQEDIAYPNDPKVMIKVDDDLKQLFRGIELPRDMVDIEKELQKNGMKPATNTAKRRAMAQVHGVTSKPKPKKKREITKRTKLTNAHLPELFQNLNVPDC